MRRHFKYPILAGVSILVLFLGTLLGSQAPIAAGRGVEKSFPPDLRRYVRKPVPQDYTLAASIQPSVLLVDPVVSNTDATLSGLDSLNDGETSIAVNPADPTEMVISSFRWGWGNSVSVMHTTDGGFTWTEEFSVPAPIGWPGGCPCDWAFDYGRSDLVSGTILANSPTVAKGTDIVTGTTSNPALVGSWGYYDPPGAPAQAQETNFMALGNVDRPHLVVNRDPADATQDNVYVTYADFNGGPDVRVSVSYGANPPNFTVDNLVAVGSNINPSQVMAKDPRTGYVYVQWGTCTAGCSTTGVHALDYHLSRSTDGGATWSLNGNSGGIVVANANSTIGGKYGANAILAPWHHGAVDPTTGDYYYVYGARDGAGIDRLSIVRLQGDGSGGMTVGPASWASGPYTSFMPSVAVAEDGTVGVFYYTFDGYSVDNYPIYSAHLAMSVDHGTTFDDQTLMTFLSSGKVDPNDAKQRVLGDYQQMKTLGRVFYGSFTANGVQFGRPYADHDPIFFRTAVGPLIAVKAPLDFGTVCRGESDMRQIEIFNTGTASLVVSSVAPLAGSDPTFRVDTNPILPVSIAPGSHVDFAVYCEPTTLGNHSATIRIQSNDPDTPAYDVTATCTTPPGDVRLTGSAAFGEVCAAGAEKTISICNVGSCDLNVTSVAFDPPCPEFTLVNNPFPAVVSHDACVDLVIRFTPTTAGAASCTLKVASDDPDTPVLTVPVTASVSLASIDVPPDLNFPPTVVQDVGACTSQRPFPISNKGHCPLTITNITLSGPESGDYSFVGLPSFPINLQPGHTVGDGNFAIVFAPKVVERYRDAVVQVTYVLDPIAGTTAVEERALCGEGTRTGARVLVTKSGVNYSSVKSLRLQRITGNRNRTRVDTIETLKDVALVTVSGDPPCPGFSYHREYGTESNPIQLLPGSYQVTATVRENGLMYMKTVAFDVQTCGFNPQVVVDFGAPAGVVIVTAGEGESLDTSLPTVTQLRSIEPNPLAGAARISFDLAREGRVTLDVYDVAGRRIERLLDETMPAGSHQAVWDGRDEAGRRTSPGVYVVRLVTQDVKQSLKVVIVE